MKEGEGVNQRTYMHHPVTDNSVMARRKRGQRLGGSGQSGGKWRHCNSSDNKKKFLKKTF